MQAPARPHPPLTRRMAARVAFLVAVVGAVVGLVARLDTRPNLAHVDVAVLSGAPEGNYHALVASLAASAGKRGARIQNVPSGGSAENLGRLAAAERGCDVQFALSQGGMPMPSSERLRLIGRLAKSESVFFLGKNADAIHDFADLRGLKIGIGPVGSGAAVIAKLVLEDPDFAKLGVVTSTHPLTEQVDLLASGALDLGVFVMDEDAALIVNAVHDRGLQIAGFSRADVVARKHAHLSTGRIGAGQFDAIRVLPPEDKRVLRVDTLVVGNGCAKRSQTLGLLVALSNVFPDFVRHNRETPNTSGFELEPTARGFFDHQGLETVDEYAPRLGDVMPPGNWAYVVMAISVLFNVMGLANRFILWRIDAKRVRVEAELATILGPIPLADLALIDPNDKPGTLAGVAKVAAELEAMVARCRKLSLSPLVPMGGEMVYRYQEALMLETLGALHAFEARATGR